MIFPPSKKIATNQLLIPSENGIPLENMLKMVEFSIFAHEQGELDNNLRFFSSGLIHAVHSSYGEHGLTGLMLLAMGHEKWEFDHFISYLNISLALQKSIKETVDLKLNNRDLPSNPAIHFFNTTYLQTTLARPLYAAGRHPGSLVYGVSGPRILISHPFQGITKDIYNIYDNASDLVAVLTHRGYHGRFHFLDYLSGLDEEINGVPRWAIWFSIIAQHSDLVVFVRRHEGELGSAQILESQVVPDWVPKIIEDIPISHIQNAPTPKLEPGMKRSYSVEGKTVSEEEWIELQKKHSHPHINFWSEGNIPKDRFVHMQENGRIEEYPLNVKLFG